MDDQVVNEALESMNDEGSALLANTDSDLMFSRNRETGSIVVIARGDWAVEVAKVVQGTVQ